LDPSLSVLSRWGRVVEFPAGQALGDQALGHPLMYVAGASMAAEHGASQPKAFRVAVVVERHGARGSVFGHYAFLALQLSCYVSGSGSR
jgi:hypothetical protein